MFSQDGSDAAETVRVRVINVNLVNWTVDVIAQFDRKYYFDIQVGMPYLHYNNGEGIYAVPEVGATAMMTIPSDSSPPYLQCFVMPMEVANATDKVNDPDTAVTTGQDGTQSANTSDTTNADAPAGTRSRGGSVPNPQVDATFAGGRPAMNPGDIGMRTRDGNFMILHRGGVLEIGATELASRIFIPLGNKILDISGEYEHQNSGGTEWWGIQEGPSITNAACQRMDTYRLLVNSQYADMRIAKGMVFKPVPEPAGSPGADAISGFGETNNPNANKTTNPIVYEVAIAAQGFKTRTGELVNNDTVSNVKLKFFFDQNGNTFLRSEGSAYFAYKGKVTIAIGDAFDLSCKTLSMTATDGAMIDGGPSTEIKGEIVRLQEGSLPVARQGDAIQGGVGANGIPVPMFGVLTLAGSPPYQGAAFSGTISIPTGVFGAIISGNPNLLG